MVIAQTATYYGARNRGIKLAPALNVEYALLAFHDIMRIQLSTYTVKI